MQDAAYGSLLKRKRREVHGRIAGVLESRFPERGEKAPELLARHFTEAGLPDKAAPYWRDAWKLSSRRSAYAEAFNQFTEGLNVLGGDSDDTGRLRAVLEMQTGLADSLV